MYQTLKTNIEDGIMTITLNRPERLNALNMLMIDEMIDALDYADENDEVRVIIMTGEGRAFCAGADLDKDGDIFKSDLPMEDTRDGGGLITLRIYDLNKPIIG